MKFLFVLDISLQQRRTHETHEKLAELKVEYDRKMLIIDEIKREKELRDKLEIQMKEEAYKKRGQEVKVQTDEYKFK